MKRLILNLAILLIVLTLTSSSIAVLPVTSQDKGKIIPKLEELRGMVEGEHPSLANKVNAVIHQIEAGAFNGALNKLVNDVNKTITAWVENPAELYKKLNEIVDLIKGITPPPTPEVHDIAVTEVTAEPLEVQVGQSVFIDVEVENQGDSTETFDVTVYFGLTIIKAKTDVSLDEKEKVMLSFEWVTRDVDVGTAKISAAASTVPSETDISDNTLEDGSVTVQPSTEKDVIFETVRINSPTPGSYLRGVVEIKVFTQDKNFEQANLTINDQLRDSWSSAGEHTYTWTTTYDTDGVYTIKLKAVDTFNNTGERTVSVTVDNTTPEASIDAPPEGRFLRLWVLIKVRGNDANFERMGVRIDGESVKNWTAGGSEILEWDTQNYDDSVHRITLTVTDKARNSREVLRTVTVDNTPPNIGTPTWSPKEPTANEEITINVTVTEPSYGSGVKNVTLWYWNTTMDEGIAVPMTFKNGNWTATITNQSGTDVTFLIEAFDNAGNRAETEELELTVAGPAGVPLAWILAAIAAIGAGTGGGIYYWRRRRKKSGGKLASSTPT